MSKWAPHNPANDNVLGRIIYKMTKPKSRSYLVYTEDSIEPWFISEYTVAIKAHHVLNRSIFIAKDIPNVIASRQHAGWTLEMIEEPLEELAKI